MRLLVTVMLAALLCVPMARADSAVIPDTPDLPWTHPAHESPLELLASRIASGIAGRPVRVYCNGQGDWDALRQPAHRWGYVPPPTRWFPALGTYADSSTHTHLAPVACEHLWRFAKASSKPTKCQASRTETVVRRYWVSYRTKVTRRVVRRVKVNGVYVTRRVPMKVTITRTRPENREETTTVSAAPVPCYKPDVPAGVTWRAPDASYRLYVIAIHVLAHESFHLADFTAGKPVVTTREAGESRAECFGMQHLARVAVELGAAPEDARSIALYYAENMYAGWQATDPAYWSADCRAGGPLDLNPATSDWPTG